MSSYEGLCPDCRQVECDEACMKATSSVGLLPLPDWMECLGEVSAAHIRDYARANVEHRTEALRAEVDKWRQTAITQSREMFQAMDRAERLTEALRKAIAAGLPDDVRMDAMDALHPTAAQETDDGQDT